METTKDKRACEFAGKTVAQTLIECKKGTYCPHEQRFGFAKFCLLAETLMKKEPKKA